MNRISLLKLLLVASLCYVARVVPHLPNLSPLLMAPFFLSKQVSRPFVMLALFIVLLLSDITLSLINGYSVFGGWSIFTYSGILILILTSSVFLKKENVFYISLSAGVGTFVFWLWTNGGTWLLSGMYPHTALGLMACYELALPFLVYSLLGSFIWAGLFWGAPYLLEKYPIQAWINR